MKSYVAILQGDKVIGLFTSWLAAEEALANMRAWGSHEPPLTIKEVSV
jgi:hypothetical protein